MRVTDSRGAKSENDASVTITVQANTAPAAALTASPTSGTAPLTVAFDGSGSSDPDQGDSIASYTFDFGDGSAPVTQPGPTLSHTYQAAGTYTARLTVTDTHGAKSTNDASVLIGVQPKVTCSEDDDSHLAYDPGWHTVKDADASAGHKLVRTLGYKGNSGSAAGTYLAQLRYRSACPPLLEVA